MHSLKFRAFYRPDIDMNQPHKFVQKVIDDELYFVMEEDEDFRYPFAVPFQDQECGDWIIQQYTGMTDKDDEAIYEGDIINDKYVVKFHHGGFKFMYIGMPCLISTENIKITGNIYAHLNRNNN